MGIRFHKSIKLGNYLRLNLSGSGVSATVGKKGASINIGKRGTFLNLSPALVGVNGTGISYRQRILGGTGSKKKQSVSASEKVKKPAETPQTAPTAPAVQEAPKPAAHVMPTPSDILENYSRSQEARINIHRYADPVRTLEDFRRDVEELDSEAAKELAALNIAGDEDTIESFISSYMNNLQLAYDVRVNYELEDHILYVDLDLPEIENLSEVYPALSRGKITQKKKTAAMLREEYAQTVMSLGVFLSACFFNQSPYIDEIVMSGFTTVRNKDGDLFILRFENRINLSKTFSFKSVKPYEMESVMQVNAMVEDAVLALKEWGYKSADISRIYAELSAMKLESVSDYVREGLRLLSESAES